MIATGKQNIAAMAIEQRAATNADRTCITAITVCRKLDTTNAALQRACGSNTDAVASADADTAGVDEF